MKSVFILRHAKSSWKRPDVNDHDRPLNTRELSPLDKIEAYEDIKDIVIRA